MARRPSRGYVPGPAYSRPSVANLRKINRGPKEYHYGGGVAYSTWKSAPRAEASGKRSYRDSRGRIRYGKPSTVQRYHARKRAAK